jgi:DNA-binding CsgD family transcriptional regulator
VRALVEADMGLVEEARASAAEGLAAARESSNAYFTIAGRGALGRLELALGDLKAAGELLRDLPERLHTGGLDDPTNPVWADAIEALVALGERERAATYLDRYEALAERLGGAWAPAAAARCRGLLAGAERDFDTAFAAFDRALALLAGSPHELERGRTLLAFGSVRIQATQRRLAREALVEAKAVFERLGAPLWSQRAEAQLRRISGRRAAGDELTGTEQRVARLAADGHSNKEIAAALFMGRSTVEAHLSRTYRKLGLRSRTELAARFRAPSAEATKPVDVPPQT